MSEPSQDKAAFPLDEGLAYFECPARLSPESYELLEAWIGLILRHAKRTIVIPIESAKEQGK